jgi:hypothetical protein
MHGRNKDGTKIVFRKSGSKKPVRAQGIHEKTTYENKLHGNIICM